MDSSGLDEVGRRMADAHIGMSRAVGRMAAPGERFGWFSRPLSVLLMLAGLPRMLRTVSKEPDHEETVRLYRVATGVDRDRAAADMAAVQTRLTFLLGLPDARIRLICSGWSGGLRTAGR